MQPTRDERCALTDVREFAMSNYSGALVVLHASAFWSDNVLVRLDENEAKALGIVNNKCVRGELTPDYAVFAESDVVCAYVKRASGHPDPEKPDRRVEKGTRTFQQIVDYERNIPYIVYEDGDLPIKSGRRNVVVLRPGALALAVLDHKGGKKDYNSPGSRARVAIQARRFGARDAYVVVNKESEARDLFRDLWSRQVKEDKNIRLDEEKTADDYGAQGADLVCAFLNAADPEEQVVEVNEPFAVPLIDADGDVLEKPLVGELDCVIRKDGEVMIVDWKTSARRWPKDQAAKSLQPTAYVYAYRQLHGADVPMRFDRSRFRRYEDKRDII